MRQTTSIWAKAESKGRPKQTMIVNGELGDVLRQIVGWCLRVEMGHHINIKMARTEAEVNPQSIEDEVMGIFDSIMSQENEACAHEDKVFRGAIPFCAECNQQLEIEE